MYCHCRDEFDWLMKMLEKGNCFGDYEDLNNFIDKDLLDLRYMKKRFGYLFYDENKYIKKVNGRNAIFVNKELQFVCRKPEEPTFHGIDENVPPLSHNRYLNTTIPMEDTERYEIKFLDEIDRGDPFITYDEKYQDKRVKDTTNILKKIKLVQPEIYNSDEFYEVLYSKKFDKIEVEKDIKKFYQQVKKYVLNDFYKDEVEEENYELTEEEFKNSEIGKLIMQDIKEKILGEKIGKLSIRGDKI